LKLKPNIATLKTWLSAKTTTGHGNSQQDLHLAAWVGNIGDMKMHIRLGEDLSASDHYGWTALHLAVWNMHTEIAIFLLDAVTLKTWPSIQSQDGTSAHHLAALNDDVELIKRLLEAGADSSAQNKEGLTALLCAAKAEHVDAINALKETLRADESKPLHWAAVNNYVNAIKALKNAGFDVF